MKLFRNLTLALTLGSICVANAASINWLTTPAIPTSVEILATYTSTSPYTEATTYVVVYVSGIQFLAAYNTDKGKAFYETAKTAFATGKKLNVKYDTDYQLGASLWQCTDLAPVTGACNAVVQSTGGPGGYKIHQLSIQ